MGRGIVGPPARTSATGPRHDLWVVPYADMMTLLFALFVVLYAMGVQDLEKLKTVRDDTLVSCFPLNTI